MKINVITFEQMQVLIKNMDKDRSKAGTNFRILVDGCAVDVFSGRVCSKGSNVIYHPMWWDVTKIGAERIRKFIEKNNPGKKVVHTWISN